MKAVLTHYLRDHLSNKQVYQDRIPVLKKTIIPFPITFRYGNFNEPLKVQGTRISVEDVVSIEVEPLSLHEYGAKVIDEYVNANNEVPTAEDYFDDDYSDKRIQ